MSVRAKFLVTSITRRSWGKGAIHQVDVSLNPVTAAPGEDKAFWDATPSGKLEMTITNPAAYEQFQPGDVFYLDFIKAE